MRVFGRASPAGAGSSAVSHIARCPPQVKSSTSARLPTVVAVLLLPFPVAVAVTAQQPSIDIEADTAIAAAGVAQDPAELEAARAQLLELGQRYPRSLYPRFVGRSRALVEAASLGRRLGLGNAAAGELLHVLEREAENQWTARAHLELAELVLADGDWRLAADHLWQARQGALREAHAEPDGSRHAVDVARLSLERMTRIHRLILRPLAGHSPWTTTRAYLPHDYLPEKLKLKKPRFVAAGPRGELVIADDNRAVLFDPDRKVVATRELRGLARPSLGPAGALGGLSAVVPTANTVMLLDDPSAVTLQRPSGGRLDQIITAHRGPFGSWTVLSRRVDTVLRYLPDGRLRDFTESAMARPIDLALDTTGAIHALDGGSRQTPAAVLTFASDGSLEKTFRSDWQRPAALDADPLGNRYVLEQRTNQILVYDPDGNLLNALGPVLPGGIELRTPTDLAVDGMGRIFIAEGRLGTVLAVE